MPGLDIFSAACNPADELQSAFVGVLNTIGMSPALVTEHESPSAAAAGVSEACRGERTMAAMQASSFQLVPCGIVGVLLVLPKQSLHGSYGNAVLQAP
jgi:hypothetical protein